MKFENWLSSLVLFVFIGAVCEGQKQQKSTIKKTQKAGTTRALYPYLKRRGGSEFRDGDDSRLKSLAWHPTDQVFAVAGGPNDTEAELSIYEVTGSGNNTRMAYRSSVVVETGPVINSVAWDPSGVYLATGATDTEKQLNIYTYSSTALTLYQSLTWGGEIRSVAWHPSGKFIAIGGTTSTTGYHVAIYAFDEITPALIGILGIYGVKLGSNAPVHSLAWDSTGTYLAVGCGGASTGTAALQLYQFNACLPYSLVQKSVIDFGGTAAYVKALAWSSSGTYLAAGGYSGPQGVNELVMYSATNGILTSVSGATIDCGESVDATYIDALAWDPQSQYLLAAGYNFHADENRPNKIQQIVMYTFKNNTFVPKVGTRIRYSNDDAGYVAAVGWSPSRQYVVVGGYKPKNDKELWLMEFLTAAN